MTVRRLLACNRRCHVTATSHDGEREGTRRGSSPDPVRRHPLAALGWALVAVGLVLGLVEGWREIAQATINGVVAGNYFALGAVGLTLIFGVLRLVNFAHGEFLTFGAYMLIVGNALDLPSPSPSSSASSPQRRSGSCSSSGCGGRSAASESASCSSFLALGLAFFMRNAIAFVAGPEDRASGANVTASVSIGELRIGRTELIVTVLGILTIAAVALVLRYTLLGKQARALSDSVQLSETTGINTDRVVLVTWAASAGLAGLAGIFYALRRGA